MATATALSDTTPRVGRGAKIRQMWSSFDTPITGRRVPGTVPVAVAALLVGTAASIVCITAKINMDYADAMSHLTIARRIVDGKAPGFQQLGTVWLPAPHLLLLPFVQSLWLWKTGTAAAILGTICLVATCSAVYRIAARLGARRTGRLVAVAMILANPSLLYLFTTALTEPVLIASIFACIAGLAGWVTSKRNLSGGELAVFAGIPAGIAVLTRYEGWALLASGTIFVILATYGRDRDLRYSIRMAASFAAVPAIAIAWWLAYNYTIYQNPLEFMNGEYSAAAHQDTFIREGLLTTKGNLGLSFWVFNWSVLDTAGVVVVVLGLAGLAWLTWRWGVSTPAMLVWLTAASPVFLIVLLALGQHHMANLHSLPPGLYATRYAVIATPMFAVMAAMLLGDPRIRARTRRALTAIAVAALIGQTVWWSQDVQRRSAVLAEAQQFHTNAVDLKDAAAWMGANYDGGGILMDESADGNAVLPLIGIPLRNFYIRAAGDAFDKALADPNKYARWIYMHRTELDETSTEASFDRVTRAMLSDPQFEANYSEVYTVGPISIFRRIGGGP